MPITRLVYQRGAFDAEATDLVVDGDVWWSLSLPFQGVSLLLSRTFFSLQRPWLTTGLSLGNLSSTRSSRRRSTSRSASPGIVIGTVAGTIAMALAQACFLRRELGGVEGRQDRCVAALKMLAAAAVLAGVSYGVWYGLDEALGRVADRPARGARRRDHGRASASTPRSSARCGSRRPARSAR